MLDCYDLSIQLPLTSANESVSKITQPPVEQFLSFLPTSYMILDDYEGELILYNKNVTYKKAQFQGL